LARRDVHSVQSGERTNTDGKPVGNKILLALPNSEYLSVRAHLEFVELPHHRVLHEPNESLHFVYFPNHGLLSLVVVMESGQTVEVGIVGKEGIAGIPSGGGEDPGPQETRTLRMRMLRNNPAAKRRTRIEIAFGSLFDGEQTKTFPGNYIASVSDSLTI
jgi:hypothetical protein